MTSRDETQLLEAWSTGDQTAAGELMQRFYDRVFRFFDIRAPAAAEDLTQRTFLACIESHTRLRELASFRAFLFGIARNQLLRHMHERQRVQRASQFSELVTGGPALTASRIVAIHQEQQLLLRALQTLPLDSQIAIELFYWEAMPSAEIAEVLGIGVSAVTSRLSRARQGLRSAVEQLHASDTPRASLLQDLEYWVGSMAELELDAAVRYRSRVRNG